MIMRDSPYDQKYADEGYYWGRGPSAICDVVLELIRPSPGFRPKLLDLGCGEGRNAVYFASHGFEVVGLDLSLPGLTKTKRYAGEVDVRVQTIQADILDYELADTYDVIFSTGTLHYLPPEMRSRRFKAYKECTSPTGVNAFSVLVSKPFIPRAPDAEERAYLFKSGELMSYYWDWEILYSVEEIFDCMSSGVPHKHAVNRIVAGRYGTVRAESQVTLQSASDQEEGHR
jgi:tellurite methyltransferase